jgi:hypothetical protein
MRVNKSQLVELKIFGISGGNTGTTFQFQDQPYLRDKKITGLESFIVNEVPVSTTGATVVSESEYEKGFLTLYCTDPNNSNSLGEWIQNVPMTVLHRVQNGAGTLSYVLIPYMLSGQIIIWDKSYIRLTSALGNTTDRSFLFNVYFE